MAPWRYEISLLVLKKYFTSERSERVKYFSKLEDKFRISARPCNILYLINARISVLNSLNTLLIYYLGFVVYLYCFATM